MASEERPAPSTATPRRRACTNGSTPLTPAPNGLDGKRPGPLVAGGDGHYYGVTDFCPTTPEHRRGTPELAPRAGAGGTFTYETLRTFDTADLPASRHKPQLTLGADGLLYGYAQERRAVRCGDDSPASIPPKVGRRRTRWPLRRAAHVPTPDDVEPRPRPCLGTDGMLYGLANAPAAAGNRGGLYRLNPHDERSDGPG